MSAKKSILDNKLKDESIIKTNSIQNKSTSANLREKAEVQLDLKSISEFQNNKNEEILHELHVHQIELEMQNEELRLALIALEESRDRYESLYEFSPVGYLTLSQDGLISEINLTGATLLGVDRNKLINSRFSRFVSMEDSNRWHRHFISMLKYNEKKNILLTLNREDGNQLHVSLECRYMDIGSSSGLRVAVTDITDFFKLKEEIQEREHRLQIIFEQAPDPAFITDFEAHILDVNEKACEELGYTRIELQDMYMHNISPNGEGDFLSQAQMDNALAFESIYLRKDGTSFPVDVRLSIIQFGSQKLLLAFARNISERKNSEKLLREADRRKDEFLAMLAHELRNPLTPIRNAAHVIGRLDLNEPSIKWAQNVIETQVDYLTRMVEDLLDISRITYGKVLLKQESIDFAILIDQLLVVVKPLAESKGQQLCIHLLDNAIQLVGDPVRLFQIFFNLLDNSIKFTPEGGRIDLTARLTGSEIEISIQDNGIGIPAALLPFIFDLFQQGERSLERNQGGLGIGLSLVKLLTEMHGGRVTAESKGQNLGSTVTVWLPANLLHKKSTIQKVNSPVLIPLLKRVLVVDDDFAVAESTAMLFEIEGYEVRVSHSGQSALKIIPNFQPQIVFLDIGLKGIDGFETAKQIRRLLEGSNLYLVAMTGYGDEKTKSQAFMSGFDHFLVKPAKWESLSEALNKATVFLENINN